MTTSVSYDWLNAQERQRWGVLYLVVGGTGQPPDPTMLKTLLAAQLPEFDLSQPVALAVSPVSGTPFEVTAATHITAIKWPIRVKKGKLTAELEREIQIRLRSSVNTALMERGIEVAQFDLEPAGQDLMGDHGIPPTPSIPVAPVHLWPFLLVAVGALLVAPKALMKG